MLEVCILLGGLVLDRLTKWLAITQLQVLPGGELELWPGVFHFQYVENRGVAFGLFPNSAWIFAAVSLLVAAAIAFLLIQKHDRFPLWVRGAMAAVLAGALGNAIDRIFQGHVTDFLYFKLINFAVFNVADSLVVVGLILIAVYFVFVDRELVGGGKQ